MTTPKKPLDGFIYEPNYKEESPFDGFTVFPSIGDLKEKQPEKKGRPILRIEFNIVEHIKEE